MKNVGKMNRNIFTKFAGIPICSILIILALLGYLYFHRTVPQMLRIVEYGLIISCLTLAIYATYRLLVRQKKK